MPQYENTGENVDAWSRATGNGSSLVNLCWRCACDVEAEPKTFNGHMKPYGEGEPEGDEGWLPTHEAQDYSEDHVLCDACGSRLSNEDK